MRSTAHTAAAAVAAICMIAAGAPAGAADKAMTVSLKAQNASGENGTATLTAQGDKTRVELNLTGAPADAQPAHVHEGGCAKLDPKPKYPLSNVVNGKSSTVVPVPIAQLTGANLAINVHKSASDLQTYVACGDIGAP